MLNKKTQIAKLYTLRNYKRRSKQPQNSKRRPIKTIITEKKQNRDWKKSMKAGIDSLERTAKVTNFLVD